MTPLKPIGHAENVSYDASVASTRAFSSVCTVVRIVATTNCSIVFAGTPVATVAAGILLTAGVPEYFKVTPGQKVAAIKFTGGTAGVLNIVEMTN